MDRKKKAKVERRGVEIECEQDKEQEEETHQRLVFDLFTGFIE